MEKISSTLTLLTPGRMEGREETSPQRLMRSLGISPEEGGERLAILAKILLDDRLAHQYEVDDPRDTDILAQAMLPVTRSIPVEYLYESYVVAMEMRAPGDTYQIKGVEMVAAFNTRIRGLLEMESVTHGGHNQKLLPERSAAGCPRCVKELDQASRTMVCREVMPDGSVGGPCDHRPMTDEERAERGRANAERLASIRAEVERAQAARRKAEEKARPKFVNIRMECDGCRRRVDSDGVMWKDGDACGALLSAGDESYTIPKLCEGRLFSIRRGVKP
jgi:hypothetical protein